MEHLKTILRSNPSIFNLKFEGYENGKVIFSEPTEYALKAAQKDFELFQERQQKIFERQTIAQGDWVLLPNGEYSRVTVDSWPDSIQIGGHFGSSVYINSNGTGSYSGGCGDSIDKKNIEPTDEYKDGLCWLFHEGYSGAHRGVSHVLKFKVWRAK